MDEIVEAVVVALVNAAVFTAAVDEFVATEAELAVFDILVDVAAEELVADAALTVFEVVILVAVDDDKLEVVVEVDDDAVVVPAFVVVEAEDNALVAPVANPAAAAEIAIVWRDSLLVVSLRVVLVMSSREVRRLPLVFTDAFTADVVAIVAAVPAPALEAAAPHVANDPAPAVAIPPATAIVICPVWVRPADFSFQLRLVSSTADNTN